MSQRELSDLRQLFTGQMAELESKYSSEHTALSDLQRKFSKIALLITFIYLCIVNGM